MQDIDEEEGVRAVHEAFRLGINYFDTSPFYGETRSEQARCEFFLLSCHFLQPSLLGDVESMPLPATGAQPGSNLVAVCLANNHCSK